MTKTSRLRILCHYNGGFNETKTYGLREYGYEAFSQSGSQWVIASLVNLGEKTIITSVVENDVLQCGSKYLQKCILKLDVHDDKDKRKALKTVSTLSGIDAITMNMKDRTLTVVGSVDPINVVSKLRKLWPTDIVSVGPAKEPEKKEEPKKEEGKKEEGKKEDAKKEEGKKDEAKKEDDGKKEEPKKKEEGKEEEKKSAPAPQPRMIMPYRPLAIVSKPFG
ncbi:heavy metal-associated isoprenylated plant protein 39-like protein [Tanacetum coccineum]